VNNGIDIIDYQSIVPTLAYLGSADLHFKIIRLHFFAVNRAGCLRILWANCANFAIAQFVLRFKGRVHCFLMQVVINKYFLLNPEKKTQILLIVFEKNAFIFQKMTSPSRKLGYSSVA